MGFIGFVGFIGFIGLGSIAFKELGVCRAWGCKVAGLCS